MCLYIWNDENRSKTESTVVSQSWENGGNEWLLMTMAFCGDDDENILKLDCGDVYTTLWLCSRKNIKWHILSGWTEWYMNYISKMLFIKT